MLDARLCLSYLTIEKRGRLPAPLREALGTHVYGCDICQEVCPWNARPAVSPAAEWRPRAGLEQPSLVALWRAADVALEALVAAGPMTRAPLAVFRRNLAIAIGNAAATVPADLLDDALEADETRPSLADAAVVEAVAWARQRLRGV